MIEGKLAVGSVSVTILGD